jgi:glycosyltransferase involved in cell wall biosynthesis
MRLIPPISGPLRHPTAAADGRSHDTPCRIGDTTGVRTRPLRMLHIVDGLGGGGVESWLWDLVRLSDPHRIQHRIVTVLPENPDFVFAERLRQAGAYAGHSRRHEAQSGCIYKAAATLIDGMPRFGGRRSPYSLLGRHMRSARHARGCAYAALEYSRFRPDVVHGHLYYGLSTGVWLKSWTGRPLIYGIWNLLSQLPEDGAEAMVDEYRRFGPQVDRFVADVSYTSELLAQGIPADRLHGLHASTDIVAINVAVRDARSHRQQVRQALQIPADAPLVISVGRLTPSKGHEYAIGGLARVLTRIPEAHLVVLGHGPQLGALRAAAAAAGCARHVHFAGYVEDPLPYYAAADLYLRTAVFEGENRSSYAAMAAGLPVVGFDTACPSDLLARVGHGLVVPNRDASALAGAVIEILTRPGHANALGARGASYARTHLDVRTSIDIFTSMCEEVCGRAPRTTTSHRYEDAA